MPLPIEREMRKKGFQNDLNLSNNLKLSNDLNLYLLGKPPFWTVFDGFIYKHVLNPFVDKKKHNEKLAVSCMAHYIFYHTFIYKEHLG